MISQLIVKRSSPIKLCFYATMLTAMQRPLIHCRLSNYPWSNAAFYWDRKQLVFTNSQFPYFRASNRASEFTASHPTGRKLLVTIVTLAAVFCVIVFWFSVLNIKFNRNLSAVIERRCRRRFDLLTQHYNGAMSSGRDHNTYMHHLYMYINAAFCSNG